MGIIVQLRFAGPPQARLAQQKVRDAERPEAPRRRSGANAPLVCLAGGALASRFHAWRGESGRRYVCSVFPARSEAVLGGMPEFDAAVAIAVRIDAAGRRSRLAVFELSWRNGRFQGDVERLEKTLAAGICEWHIHLLAESQQARRLAIADLTGF
jgi:hypothetical protein